MAITVSTEETTKTKKTLKVLMINDSATPSSSSFINTLSQTFPDNIRSFLSNHTEKLDYTVNDKNTIYSLYLGSEVSGVVFPLFIIQQQISNTSSDPLCDTCRCIGWGNHYVTKRKYHLIIPKVDEWKEGLRNEDCLEANTHLLHGVVHCNGFGHLLCVNNDVTNYLSGYQIMDFWDRLCSTLRTRKISLDDISRKGSMDLRLLHGVAYGRPWFGKWGYVFNHGSFGIKEEQYRRAIHILSSIEVDKIMEDFSGTSKESVMNTIIGFYREASETPLGTLSDLLRFMLDFSSNPPVQRKTAMALAAMSLDSIPIPRGDDDENIKVSSSCSSLDQDSGTDAVVDDHVETTIVDIILPKYDSFDTLVAKEGSRYPTRRLKDAAQAVLKVFEERNSIISRQDLREAVRASSIGDTGLIDFLLKHIDKVLLGDKIVQRFTNPKNRMLQFSLRTISSRPLEQEPKKKMKPTKPRELNEWKSNTPGLSPYNDILYLYENLLVTYLDTEIYSNASEVILNCKSFVKEWPLPSSYGQNLLTVSCQVMPNHEELLGDFTRKLPPGELVMVPRNATIRDLKSAVEKALRDTYFVTDTFEVLEIRNKELEKLEDDSGIQSEGGFLVKGFGLDTCTMLRYEGGFDNWIVDCRCGARDDDGERMVYCDVCNVWHHTMCNSIEDDEDVPSVFLCNRCSGDSLRTKKHSVTIR